MRSDPRNVYYANAVAGIEALGPTVVEDWRYGTMCDAIVKLGRSTVAKLHFSAGRESSSFLVLSPKGGAEAIVGSYEVNSAERMLKGVDDVEALFRALLVRKRKLPFVEYPTSRSLRAWAIEVAAIALPGEPGAKWAAESAAGVRFVQAARDIAASGSRDALLKLHAALISGHEAERAIGRPDDRGFGYASRTAQTISDARYGRNEVCWEHGIMAWLIKPVKPAPRRNVSDIAPVQEAVMEEAPALAMAC